jgi:hypothetical protein
MLSFPSVAEMRRSLKGGSGFCQQLLLLLHAEHCSLKLQQGRDSGPAPGAVHLLVLVLLLLYRPRETSQASHPAHTTCSSA